MENNVKKQYIKKAVEMNKAITIVGKIEKEIMDLSPEGFPFFACFDHGHVYDRK